MQEPLQIAFHNMESSPALERRVRELFGKLEHSCDDIISARIVLEAPHRQPHKSTLGISISIGLPGRDIVVKREQRTHEADNHSIWVLNEAFEAAGRQIEEYSRMRRHDVKTHDTSQRYSRIARLYPERDYGFIETPEGQNVYFHRTVVRGDRYDALEVGREVIYTLADEEGPMGPMASSVQLIGSDHPIV